MKDATSLLVSDESVTCKWTQVCDGILDINIDVTFNQILSCYHIPHYTDLKLHNTGFELTMGLISEIPSMKCVVR